ncbi:MAG: SMC-Scp complex subunit ScpB [Candidatus Omnitrophica bacterium]|nr:SMC-Scp complex subunit ScpB [Candidatus Omnitrophota bacterium]
MAKEMTKKVIEALLFVSEKPLTIEDFRQALDGLDEEAIKQNIEKLREEYAKEQRSFSIAELAGGYQIVTNPEFAPWIGKLFRRDEIKFSGPSLETLAIIAYKQPLTRSEIERIRGVNVEGVLKTLLDKNLIKIRGRKDAPGRPITYGTTDEFLQRFGLKGLEQLPKLRDFTEHDLDFDKENEKVKIKVEQSKEVDEDAPGQQSA